MNSHCVLTTCKTRLPLLSVVFILFSFFSHAQQKIYDGKEFSAYRPGAFTPKRGLFYSFHLAPVYTIDPLGFGGKSTYALSVGTRINIWESKTDDLRGLKIKGWYVGGGYEYYPQQFDMVFITFWLRVNAFIPLVGKIDYIYAFDGIHSGLMARSCIGVEVKKLSLFLCGTTSSTANEQHPKYFSDYTTAGSILLVIPIYTRD